MLRSIYLFICLFENKYDFSQISLDQLIDTKFKGTIRRLPVYK